MVLYRDLGTVRFFPPSFAAVSAQPFGQYGQPERRFPKILMRYQVTV
jgi:hypothetical protein